VRDTRHRVGAIEGVRLAQFCQFPLVSLFSLALISLAASFLPEKKVPEKNHRGGNRRAKKVDSRQNTVVRVHSMKINRGFEVVN
jgi:hypothetical protein